METTPTETDLLLCTEQHLLLECGASGKAAERTVGCILGIKDYFGKNSE